MKKIVVLLISVLLSYTGTMLYAQENSKTNCAESKNEKEIEKAKVRIEEQKADSLAYEEVVQALKDKEFVLEADQVVFRDGYTAFVTSNTNFVMVNKDKSTVQVAFNTPYPGPNGIGGVTVDGNVSNMRTNDKRGNISCSFSVQGVGISAQIVITIPYGCNNASVTVSPNFNNRTLTLNGKILPLSQSNVFKGRSL